MNLEDEVREWQRRKNPVAPEHLRDFIHEPEIEALKVDNRECRQCGARAGKCNHGRLV